MLLNSQKFHSTLLKTARTGQLVIRCALDAAMDPGLREILRSQLRELDAIETEALILARRRGWEPKEPDFLLRFLTDRMTRFRVTLRSSDSRTAEIMIRRNTEALIANLRELHRYRDRDPQIRILAQKLQDCDTAHIRRLQKYL